MGQFKHTGGLLQSFFLMRTQFTYFLIGSRLHLQQPHHREKPEANS